jgi:hypothetical protein
MEVLAARYRLGERTWPFSSRLAPAIRALSELDLVTEMNAQVPKTIRASLTEAGREAAMSVTYRAPAEHVTEHAVRMSSGAMTVRYDHPDIDRIFPLAEWIRTEQRFGGRVWRRRIIVVDDWEEVPRG